MGHSDQAWSAVAEQLKAVGSRFKVQYHEHETNPGPAHASQEEVKDAFKTLGDSSMAALGTFGTFAKDPETHADLRKTTELVLDALAASFSDLASDLSKGSGSEESGRSSPSDTVAESDDTDALRDDVADEPTSH
ncbi:MAG: hypothetical protein ACR2N7_02700 [Acidimicrobiia bacterium]